MYLIGNFLKIFNLSHLLLDLAPSVDSHSSHLATRPQCCTVIIMVYYNHGFPFGRNNKKRKSQRHEFRAFCDVYDFFRVRAASVLSMVKNGNNAPRPLGTPRKYGAVDRMEKLCTEWPPVVPHFLYGWPGVWGPYISRGKNSPLSVVIEGVGAAVKGGQCAGGDIRFGKANRSNSRETRMEATLPHSCAMTYDAANDEAGAPVRSEPAAGHGPVAGSPAVFQTPTRPARARAARPKTTPVSRRKLPLALSPALEGARALFGATAGAAVEVATNGAEGASLPPLDLGSAAATVAAVAAAPAPMHTLTLAPASAPAPAPSAAPAQAPATATTTSESTQTVPPTTPPGRKRQLQSHVTVSHPAPAAPKRPKHIARAGPIEVTRAEVGPVLNALKRPNGDVEDLIGATIGYLLVTPMAYRSAAM